MPSSPAEISAIFARHHVYGAWQALPAHGIANHIFATDDVVLRIATDHPEARPDARTEIVAAPVARAHGIAVPRLLAFEAGVYSLWDRVHAETLSELPFLPRAWRELGGELARLHDRVRACDDPNGWLDTPGPYDDPAPQLRALVARGAVATDAAATLEHWLDALRPALELGSLPIESVPHVVAGYEAAGGELSGSEANILWDQIGGAVDSVETGYRADAIHAVLAFSRDAEPRWRLS